MSNSPFDRAPRALRSVTKTLLALGLIAPGISSAADVSPALTEAARVGQRVDALLVFADDAPVVLAPLAPTADFRVRRRALIDALQARADISQRDTRAWLDAHGVAYRPFWVSNVIAAQLAPSELSALASRGEIARIVSNAPVHMALPTPEPSTSSSQQVDAVEWGVMKIRAPEVWAAGITGQGVVVAGEDTGYQWDHPALKPHYRGWDGSGADHNYNWHDSIHVTNGSTCGVDSPAPCDDQGHGTHTVGSVAGDDGAGNQVGVAPGARWIGCRNMDAGNGTPATYIECMQWMMAPTDLAGANANPDLAPDVINNSWGCPASEGCVTGNEIKQAVDNVVAAGIFFVASAGNAGSACFTIGDAPAIYDSSFVVGSTTSADAMSSFSSRGPVATAARVLPDLVAPGSQVRSSYPPNGYTQLSGTSMAGPHVVGTVALMIAVNENLRGHPPEIADILRRSTVHIASTQTCDGVAPTTFPNPVQGAGRIDAFAAFRIAETIFTHGYDD